MLSALHWLTDLLLVVQSDLLSLARRIDPCTVNRIMRAIQPVNWTCEFALQLELMLTQFPYGASALTGTAVLTPESATVSQVPTPLSLGHGHSNLESEGPAVHSKPFKPHGRTCVDRFTREHRLVGKPHNVADVFSIKRSICQY